MYAQNHRAIAEALNARGVATARGGKWQAMTVSNLLARSGAETEAAPPARRRGRPLEYKAMEIAPRTPALALAKAKH